MKGKKCKFCNEVILIGRSDKVFCDDYCRNTYNNTGKTKANYKKVQQSHTTYSVDGFKYEKKILNDARHRANKKGLDFNLTIEDAVIPVYCPLINHKLNRIPNNKAKEYSPSIDRIDNSKGYIKGNVMIISFKANRIKSNMSIDELKNFCNNLLKYIDEV